MASRIRVRPEHDGALGTREGALAPPAADTPPVLIVSAAGSKLRHLDPREMVATLWRHRQLIRQFTQRDVQGRYKGSSLGLAWSLVHPLVLLLVYTFLFGVVFQLRWPQSGSDRLRVFALAVFCSLSAFNVFGEPVSRAAGLVVGVPNFVKKVVFPLEVLPATAVAAALFHGAVSLALVLCAAVIVNGGLSVTVLLLPVALLPLVLLSAGMTWLVSSLGVFVRDVQHVVGLALQVLLFTTPVFYPLESVPANLTRYVRLNPLPLSIEDVRRTVLWGLPPDWTSLAWRLPVSLLVAVLGYAWFMRTKRGFADVI